MSSQPTSSTQTAKELLSAAKINNSRTMVHIEVKEKHGKDRDKIVDAMLAVIALADPGHKVRKRDNEPHALNIPTATLRKTQDHIKEEIREEAKRVLLNKPHDIKGTFEITTDDTPYPPAQIAYAMRDIVNDSVTGFNPNIRVNDQYASMVIPPATINYIKEKFGVARSEKEAEEQTAEPIKKQKKKDHKSRGPSFSAALKKGLASNRDVDDEDALHTNFERIKGKSDRGRY